MKSESTAVLEIMQEALSPQFAKRPLEEALGENRGDAAQHSWVNGFPSDVPRYYVRLEALCTLIHALDYLLTYGNQTTRGQLDAINLLLDLIGDMEA